MRPIWTLEEKQQQMKRRVEGRPCDDERSKQAVRKRARLVRLDQVTPKVDPLWKLRSARFMEGKNFSRTRIANQLGMTVAEVGAMLDGRGPGPKAAKPEPKPPAKPVAPSRPILDFGPTSESHRRRLQRESRRRVKELLAKMMDPRTEVTFVPAFAGDVPALTDAQEAKRREELNEVRRRESRDAEGSE